jgi:hypothetical protein
MGFDDNDVKMVIHLLVWDINSGKGAGQYENHL